MKNILVESLEHPMKNLGTERHTHVKLFSHSFCKTYCFDVVVAAISRKDLPQRQHCNTRLLHSIACIGSFIAAVHAMIS